MSRQLIFPMAFYVFYVCGLALFMFRTRSRSVRSGQTSLKYFSTYAGDAPPEFIVRQGRHYDNQFQVPVLFWLGCTAHLVLAQADLLTLILAWAFVATRVVHTWIHLGANHIMRRAMSFGAGLFVVILLWLQLVYFAL